MTSFRTFSIDCRGLPGNRVGAKTTARQMACSIGQSQQSSYRAGLADFSTLLYSEHSKDRPSSSSSQHVSPQQLEIRKLLVRDQSDGFHCDTQEFLSKFRSVSRIVKANHDDFQPRASNMHPSQQAVITQSDLLFVAFRIPLEKSTSLRLTFSLRMRFASTLSSIET